MTQPTTLRMCFACCTEKPEDEFSKTRPNSCKECIRTKARRRYQDNPAERERMRATSKANYWANRDEIRAKAQAERVEVRAAATQIYGGRCAKCDSADRLEFDHVHGDAGEHRKREGNGSMYRRIVRTGAPLTDVELQLLCHAHHWEKTTAERRARRLARREEVDDGLRAGRQARLRVP